MEASDNESQTRRRTKIDRKTEEANKTCARIKNKNKKKNTKRKNKT